MQGMFYCIIIAARGQKGNNMSKKNSHRIKVGCTYYIDTGETIYHYKTLTDEEYKEYQAFMKREAEAFARCILPAIREFYEANPNAMEEAAANAE